MTPVICIISFNTGTLCALIIKIGQNLIFDITFL